jgi:hypothetical protein
VNPKLKTVLVEMDFGAAHTASTIDMMTDLGWKYSTDQLRAQRDQILTVETIAQWRREKVYGMNYIFFREDKYARLFEDFLAHYELPPSWRQPATAVKSWTVRIGDIIAKPVFALRSRRLRAD